jgi:nucleotide-binding universal stress UspA family protein
MQRSHTPVPYVPLVARRTSPGPILVASDGGPASASAFSVAHLLAERAAADVRIVSALDPLNVLVPAMDAPRAPVRPGATRVGERRARLEILALSAATDATQWPVEIITGDRAPSIAQAVTEHVSPLVVTGYTHHGAVQRLVQQETPLDIARAACVPVLAVPLGLTHLPRCVVVAVGLGDSGARVCDVATALLSDALAVHFVHVRERGLRRHECLVRQEAEADDRALEHAFARAHQGWRLPANLPTIEHVLVGRTAEELLKFGHSVGADLIVVEFGVAAPRLPHRSLAPRLYREWPHALLVVPIGDPS